MAKKKRTGLDALREYEAGSTNAASSAASYGQTQTQTKSSAIKRSGLDAIREYEQYGNPGAVQDTAFDPNYRSRNYQTPEMKAAFEAYKNAVNAAKKIPNSAIGGKVSQQEYSRSTAMQAEYGTYENYLRGVTAEQGRKLGTQALRQQSALLAGQFAPATQKTREDVNALNRRTRAAQNAQRDQVRGMRRTSQELGKQIEALEEEQADAHFAADGRSANGKSPTQLQDEINALQDRKNLVDSQSVLERARDAMSGLSEEDQNLLRQYRGQELNGYEVRAYAKYDAKKALNERGYGDETLKQLAEWQEVLDDYENAQKLDAAAQEMGGSSSFMGKVNATLFSAALAPAKALGNVESLRGVLPSWAGGYQNENMPTNVYSPLYNATRLSSGIRQSVMQDMGPTGQFLYQAGTSALDSAVNMAVSSGLVGAIGGVSGAAAQDAVAETMNWVMGSQVAADSVYEGVQSGKSNADAMVDGIVEGAIEGITEKYSVGEIIESMLSGKAVWKKALRSFGSEGAEEVASNWLNRVYDVLSKQDRSEVLAAYEAYIEEGRTPVQALAAMAGDFAKEDGLSFLAGGLSGLAMAGTYAGVNRVISEVNITQTARAVLEEGEVQDVIDYGMAQEEGTKAHQLAEELQQTVDDGGEVTQKAVEDTLREVAKEQQAAVDEGEEPRVPEKLTRLEQLQQEAAQEQAQADTQERTYQIYKDAVQSAQEATRAAQEYTRAEQEQRQQQEADTTAQQRSGEMRAAQRAQRAAEQAQYDQDSLLSQIPGTEEIGELDPEQYARQQTADAEQALDEAALRQEETYLTQRAQQAGYDEQTTAYFLNGNTTGLPAEQYAASFGKIYEQGRLGASEQRAMRFAEGMNQDVAAAAYQAGLAAGQKGDTNGSRETAGNGQVGQARQRAEGAADGVRGSAAQQQRADAGRKRAEGARALAKTWDEVTVSALGLGEDATGTVRVMPEGGESASEDIKRAVKHLKAAGVKNVKIFTGQLTQSVNGQTLYADAAVMQDGTVLIRADSAEYSAFELAKHESYHILAKQNPAMAARIRTRLLAEGKITREMIESYVDAYARAYGDDMDAYLEEIVADAYAGMNRTDYGTNQLRTDVQMDVGQWKKKTGSARAPPAKMSIAQDFKSRLESWYKAGATEGAYFTLGETGATLQGLGAVESDIYMDGDKIKTILKEHPEMTIREIERIPEILDDPVLILKSRNSKNVRENSRLVLFGSVKAQDGRPVMCVLELRPTENGMLLDDMQKVSSAYTKDNDPVNFIKASFILHADKKRTIPLLRTIGFQMPITLQRSGSIGRIDYKGPKVNLYGEKFSDVFGTGTTGETVKTKFSASAEQTSEKERKNLEAVSEMLDDGSGRGAFKDAVFLRNPKLMQKIIDERGKTQTAAFQNWFAGSRATNTAGEPLLMFHGAGAKFAKFDAEGKPIWLTANIKYAEKYSTPDRGFDHVLPGASIYAGNVDRIIPAYIRVENPADVGNTDGKYSEGYMSLARRLQVQPSELKAVWEKAGKPEAMWRVINTPGMVEMLERNGYDGIRAVENGVKTWAVFSSTQVKSAVANNGSFSLTNPDIRYSAQEGRYRDLMGEKPAKYVRGLEARLVNELAENLSVPGQARREVLRPIAEDALRTFFNDGQLDRAKLDELFETAYDAAWETNKEYWEGKTKSFKDWQRANFTESIDRLTSGLRIAQRYLDAQEKAKEKLAIPQTEEETQQMWAQLKDARRAVEKAQGKTLLTEADQKVVNRLLRGETSPEYAAKLENGAQILRVYEAKAEYDMLALKLKAWNVQRRNALRDFAEQALTEAEAVKWADKASGIQYSRETMERNVRDIARKGKVSDEKANAFINKYFWPVHENESKRKNYVVAAQDKIRALQLDRQVRKGNMVSESYAVQWLGEAEFNRDYLKQHPRVEQRGGMTFDEWNAAIQEFEKQNPEMDLGKVRAAVRTFHTVYDQLFQDMNRVRIENGYEPVNYLQGYFPHFQENEEGGNILQKFARAAGIEGDVTPLPATINGLTAKFRPGIRYMANVQNRLGYATAYDVLQGFDRYIEVASDVIYHTADIQRLRALATQIRWRASDEGLQARIDAIRTNPFLNPDEANDQIANLTKDGRYALSNFVTELDEYTNLLAGKKSRRDRNMEGDAGRRFYNVMKKFESRVGANMVAANVGSALTNFIPITQAWSQVSTTDVMRGMWDTLKNYKQADGLDTASTFINNRSGYGRLATSTMDRVSAAAGILMEGIDGFTTGSVVRARYYQNLRRGMSETNAMQEADQFAAGVMADRSKGSTPTLYSARNPLVKLFTQFQLEVNNELSWIFKDMVQEERKKGVAALAKAMFKFLIGAWIYNEFYEAVVGRRAALDPLDIINDTVGDFTGYQLPNTVQSLARGEWDFEKEKPGAYQSIKNLEGNILSELPGTQALTLLGVDEALGIEIDGGRIAVASAIPNLGKIEKALLASNEDMAPAKKTKTITDELIKPGMYVATPFGGGQLRKLYQGGMAAAEGGSYTVDNEGNDILQYPVYNDSGADRAKSWAQALLFGKTATEEAQKWVESGFKSLSAKETAAYQTMTQGGVNQRESFAFVNAMKKVQETEARLTTLFAYDIPQNAKTAYYYAVMAQDTERARMDTLSENGVGYDAYMQYKQAYFKAFGTQSASQERVQTILDGMNLKKTQKAAIWAAMGKDWKEENNPYK